MKFFPLCDCYFLFLQKASELNRSPSRTNSDTFTKQTNNVNNNAENNVHDNTGNNVHDNTGNNVHNNTESNVNDNTRSNAVMENKKENETDQWTAVIPVADAGPSWECELGPIF